MALHGRICRVDFYQINPVTYGVIVLRAPWRTIGITIFLIPQDAVLGYRVLLFPSSNFSLCNIIFFCVQFVILVSSTHLISHLPSLICIDQLRFLDLSSLLFKPSLQASAQLFHMCLMLMRLSLHIRCSTFLGLDPTGSLFKDNPKAGLQRTDADFVDVIHTDGAGYGMRRAIGDVDFYPNGGRQQTACKGKRKHT